MRFVCLLSGFCRNKTNSVVYIVIAHSLSRSISSRASLGSFRVASHYRRKSHPSSSYPCAAQFVSWWHSLPPHIIYDDFFVQLFHSMCLGRFVQGEGSSTLIKKNYFRFLNFDAAALRRYSASARGREWITRRNSLSSYPDCKCMKILCSSPVWLSVFVFLVDLRRMIYRLVIRRCLLLSMRCVTRHFITVFLSPHFRSVAQCTRVCVCRPDLRRWLLLLVQRLFLFLRPFNGDVLLPMR